MGQLLLDVPGSYQPPEEFAATAYVCGLEGVPWEGRVTVEGRRITIDRDVNESGRASILWRLPELGLRTLHTCSLRMGTRPYNLPLELARGSCSRVRAQADSWQRAGLRLSLESEQQIAAGTDRFIEATLAQADADRAADLAGEALVVLESAADALVEAFTSQALSYRRQNEGMIGTLCGAVLGAGGPPTGSAATAYLSAFNAASVRLSWRDVETDAGELRFDDFDAVIRWCEQNGLRICCGPLFDFQNNLLPHWLYLIEDDFNAFVSAVSTFVQRAVERYRGRVHLWHCAASLNTPGPIPLTDEQVMRLAVATIQAVRRSDPRAPVLISVDQPWGEGLARNARGISPLHFADALIRAELGLAGVGLELRLGYQPAGTLPRSLLDVSMQIDRWGMLGLPLLVKVAQPLDATAGKRDELSLSGMRPLDGWQPAAAEGAPPSADTSRLIRLLLAKQPVHGIFWEGWDERLPHLLPAASLIDSDGRPGPLLQEFTQLKTRFLG